MLAHLTIRDFAIIEELQLPLRAGLTVFTGETGAGKSILVSALGLVLGGRASLGLIRSQVEEAVVEALFCLEQSSPLPARLEAMGLEPAGDELVIRRVISRRGRSRAFVNGSPVTTAMLRDLARDLVVVASQHEHQSLLRTDAAREALDAYAGLGPQLDHLKQAHREFCETRSEIERMRNAAQQRESRLDYLRFQLEEIDAFDPRPGEDMAMRAERDRLRNAEQLLSGAARGVATLYEDDDSVVGRLGSLEALLEPLARLDPTLGPVLDRLAEARIEVEEAAAELRSYHASLDLDPERQQEVEERLFKLEDLLRKHGPDLETLLRHREEMAGEADSLSGAKDRLQELQGGLDERQATLARIARRVGAARRQAARRFSTSVEHELSLLGMARASFSVVLAARAEIGPTGSDLVELLFGPNPGEEARPLRKIASGGELSRVMLAIKRVLAEVDTVPTYLYDEVDTGVSGTVAEAIGKLLWESARKRQVLCITHHSQVAVRADHHLRVSKEIESGRTLSQVCSLEEVEARIDELARMLGSTDGAGREHARSLLQMASTLDC